MIMIAASGCEKGSRVATDPMKEATPTIEERLTKEVVRGTLLTAHDEYYVIQNTDGIQKRVHVDQRTTLDQVVDGDMVRAYVNRSRSCRDLATCSEVERL